MNRRYYKAYEFQGYPYSSVKALKAAMRIARVREVTLNVSWHLSHNGKLEMVIPETFRVRLTQTIY